MNITSIREDNDLIMQGFRPNYLVVSVQLGTPFVSAELAIQWHNHLLQNGINTSILDLTEYDWDLNPANLKFHDLSTPEGHDNLALDLTMRNQAIIN